MSDLSGVDGCQLDEYGVKVLSTIWEYVRVLWPAGMRMSKTFRNSLLLQAIV